MGPIRVKVKFYFLFLIQEKRQKTYDEISKEARELLKDVLNGFTETPKSGNINDYKKWYILEGTRDGDKIQIKQQTVRIIIEIQKIYNENNLSDLFSIVRQDRDNLHSKSYLKDLRDKFKISIERGQVTVRQLFKYPLIEVEKEYSLKDFIDLEEEAITTFFYEVPDSRRIFLYRGEGKTKLQQIGNFLLGFTKPIPKTIMRLSRPSVITSKMSPFLRAEVINILYDACLYPMRSGDDPEKIDEETFNKMKQFLGSVLFNNEMAMANAEISRSVNILSVLMGIGAIVGIFAIIAFIPWILNEENTILGKSLIGVILAIWAIWILKVVLSVREKRK